MSSEIISIEREYKGIKYEIKGRIAYKSPCGSYLEIDSKIHLSDTLLKLYKKYPLDYMRVNHIIGHKYRPCTTKVIVYDYMEGTTRDRECKYTIVRYDIDIDEENKCLKIDIENSVYKSETYIVEKIVLEVIDYLIKLKNKKGK